MPTLDMNAPGATPVQIVRGLAAAGDVIRSSGMTPEFVDAGRACVAESLSGRRHLPKDSWHWRAAIVFAQAQEAALRACYGDEPHPPGCELLIVASKGPASYLE